VADPKTENDRLRDIARNLGHVFDGASLMCRQCEVGLHQLGIRNPCPNADRRTGEERRGSSGNKYHRVIHELATYKAAPDAESSVTVDVYSVLTAFAVTNPGLQHAAKKILCAGIRGKGDRVQDLREASDALNRAIEDAEREATLGN
jgi:hypothetical protein